MLNTYSKILIGGACVLLLAGCESMGTSTAGYSPDEDAYKPQSQQAVASNNSSGTAAGTALFDQRTGSQLYGASPFPADSATKPDAQYVTSSALKGRLAVLRIRSNRNDSNLLTVSAGLKNRSSHSLPLQVATVFKDKDGQPLSDSQNWEEITLKPHEVTQYHSVATTEDASDYLVRVRALPTSAAAQP